MKICENGVVRDMTEEEITAVQDAVMEQEAQEKYQPMTLSEVQKMLVRQQINTLEVDDQMALRMRDYYPVWSDLAAEQYSTDKAGFKFTYNDDLYKTIPDVHTFGTQWVPGVGTESLYTRIDETHNESKYDPIPYSGNMTLTNGLYYTQNGQLYHCVRDTGNPVYNALSELVGLYVEVING